eukprot:766684-Hanusia_phi.AAC.4
MTLVDPHTGARARMSKAEGDVELGGSANALLLSEPKYRKSRPGSLQVSTSPCRLSSVCPSTLPLPCCPMV